MFYFKLDLIQKKSSMRYIKLQVNWDTEFISKVKIDFGAFWPSRRASSQISHYDSSYCKFNMSYINL